MKPPQKERLAVLAGVRTPFQKAGSQFQSTPADELAKLVFAETLARSEILPAAIDEVILGCAGQPAESQNLARVAALRAGVPRSVPAVTVHRNCASGMEALTQAMLRMRAGEGNLFLVGGVESMSLAPLLFPTATGRWLGELSKARSLGPRLRQLLKFRPSLFKPRIGLLEGLTDPVSGMIMGMTAERLAQEYEISRDEQDAYARRSHLRAEAARASGRLAVEIAPVVPWPEYREVVQEDNGIRPGIEEAQLQKLRPYFDRRHGTVTVGNSCQLTDGAAALLVASESRAQELGVAPIGYLREFAYAGLDPTRMGLGPVYATARLLEKTGGEMAEYDVVELNEAFAAQVIACARAFSSEDFARRELGREEPLGPIDDERLNVNGGAIALGHPVGATGTRLVLTLLHELGRRGAKKGLATLCVGGGQGAALDLEAA